jgi:poly-beta-1,6-N-acetyl-D-glucosamine biosynthesis protein PgaD
MPRPSNEDTRHLIIDGAYDPLRDFEAHESHGKAQWHYLWYHYLRPLLLVAFWLFVLFYVYHYFFDAPGAILDNQGLLTLYGMIIAVVFAGMLLWAPVRKRRQAQARNQPAPPATVPELAQFAQLPERDVAQWRNAQLSIAYHSEGGHLNRLDVLVDSENPNQGRLARLLGMLKKPGQAEAGGGAVPPGAVSAPEK